jgi:hypothetical protein
MDMVELEEEVVEDDDVGAIRWCAEPFEDDAEEFPGPEAPGILICTV